jgi:hypothetical protein
MQALAHDRWTQYVPAQPLEPCSRAGRHDVSGVEVEAVAPGMAPDRRACARVLEVARLTQARHRLPPPLPASAAVFSTRRRRQSAGRGLLVRPSRVLARPPLDESANVHLGMMQRLSDVEDREVPDGMERRATGARPHIAAVEDERMDVKIQVEGAPKPLQHGHGAASSASKTVPRRSAP